MYFNYFGSQHYERVGRLAGTELPEVCPGETAATNAYEDAFDSRAKRRRLES